MKRSRAAGAPRTTSRRVGVLLFDGVTTLDVAGPLDAFADAVFPGSRARAYDVTTLGLTSRSCTSEAGLSLRPPGSRECPRTWCPRASTMGGEFELTWTRPHDWEAIRRYEGTYRTTDGRTLRVSANVRLARIFDASDGRMRRLVAIDADRFAIGPTLAGSYPWTGTIDFALDGSARAQRLTWHEKDGRSVEAKRLEYREHDLTLRAATRRSRAPCTCRRAAAHFRRLSESTARGGRRATETGTNRWLGCSSTRDRRVPLRRARRRGVRGRVRAGAA